MATLSFSSAVILLCYGHAVAQSTSSDCSVTKCNDQYWNERSEYTTPDKMEGYTKDCGSGFNADCPTCGMLSRYEACVQERSDACSSQESPHQTRYVKQSLRSELKSWSNVCEAPCDRMESISQCQMKLFTVNRHAGEAMESNKWDQTDIKDKVCPAIKAATTCIGKEAEACAVQAKYASEEVDSIAGNWAVDCDPSCADIKSYESCKNDFQKGVMDWAGSLGKAARSMRSPVQWCVLAETPGADCHVCKELKQMEACKDTAVGDCTGNLMADSVENDFQSQSMMFSALCKPESFPKLFDMSEVASAALTQADAEQSATTLAWLPCAVFGSLILVSLGALTYGRCRHGPSPPADAMLEESGLLTS